MKETHGVPRLLRENLSQLDHVCVVVKLLREVNHLVSSILLIAVFACSEKGRESILGNGVALVTTAGLILQMMCMNGLVTTEEEEIRTQACTHFCVESAIVWAMRFSTGTAEADAASRAIKTLILASLTIIDRD